MAARPARKLIVWTTVALASGWVGLVVDRAAGADPAAGETPGMGLWLVTPPLAAVAYWVSERRLGMGLRPRFRGHEVAWVTAVCAFPLVTAAVLAGAAAVGGLDASGLRPGALLAATGTGLAAGLAKNVFEESAWRGLLVGELDRFRANDLTVYLVSGGVWGLWHLPYYLHFLPEADMAAVLPVPRVVFAGTAVVTMLAWGVLFAEVYRVSGSIWPVVLMHAVEDAVANPMFTEGHVTMSTPAAWAFSPVLGVVTGLSYLGLGLLLRRRRRALGGGRGHGGGLSGRDGGHSATRRAMTLGAG